MAISAFQVAYRQEFINGFDKTESVLRTGVTTEFLNKGGSAVFCVNDSASNVAKNRGINGLIPYSNLSLTQNTATLKEWHGTINVNGFNIFASQGDLLIPMKRDVMAAINRKIDDDIITILNTGSVNTGAAVPGSMDLVTKADVMLSNSIKTSNSGNVTLLVTPAFLGYLLRSPEFSNSQYVSARPYENGTPAYGDTRMVYKWNGMTVIKDATLPGVGTAAEKCFIYHKDAIGQAINKGEMSMEIGYDAKQDESWARSSAFMGTVLLQNTGVVVINHNGLGLSA